MRPDFGIRGLKPVCLVLAILAATIGGSARGYAQRLHSIGSVHGGPGMCHRCVCSWTELQKRNLVMQRRDFSCGAAALATLIQYYWGDRVTESYFLKELDKILTPEEIHDRIENGLSLTDLRRVAVATGYQATMGTLTFDKLTESKVPLILGVIVDEYDHFVVYRGWDGEWIYLADPIRGNLRVHVCDFRKQWQRNAILAVAKEGEKIRDWSPLSVRADEVALGTLNWQVIRSRAVKFPVGVFPSPPVMSPAP
jgi:hypothetical protein